MPELPEVETIRRGIDPYVVGRNLNTITSLSAGLRYPFDIKALKKLQGQSVIATTRRSKHLLLHFNNHVMVLHFGMSGLLRLVTSKQACQPMKHDHLIFAFDQGIYLFLNDVRRFGYCQIIDQIQQAACLKHIGPEPLTQAFNPTYFYLKLSQSKRMIKTILLDGHIVAGIGNIYANEALFLSKIHPHHRGQDITMPQVEQLVTNIQMVLQQAIDIGGTTLKDFANPTGKPGYFSQQLFVYGRDNQPCYHCQTLIQKIKTGQRTSYICPTCQPSILTE